jgi:bidirectional [NiFe] hydrogenase diaphorase subunit
MLQTPKTLLPSTDKRWRLVEATVRRYGAEGHALIESLHTVQESFGYLDETGMRYLAAALNLPLSKVYGVATFYQYFSLKPQGEHNCVVCMGTACYIKGAPTLLEAVEQAHQVKPGQTSTHGVFSLLTARCVGSCGVAPAVVFDGAVAGKVDRAEILTRVQKWMDHDEPGRAEQGRAH